MTNKPSTSFDLLHQKIQKWIWREEWDQLHSIQEDAIPIILKGEDDLIISAATAGGKTEAAFLPICSNLINTDSHGIDVLCVSPLKALINDQFDRVEQLCEGMEIPVHKWHGDVSQSKKKKLASNPSGILLITPESLEALFVIRGPDIARLFKGLSYVVVDELHSFIGNVRGRQLQSLLNRLEIVLKEQPPRIGLSATLGDMSLAASFLRPQSSDDVQIIISDDDSQEIKLQTRGHVIGSNEQLNEEELSGSLHAICDHLYKALRGYDNLIFANSRRDVEICADILRRSCEQNRVPNEFLPHHGSLSKELREEAEAQLKDKTRPASVVCTNTLELGIDVGNVTSIAQIDSPPSVAAMRQRLGRSGRRGEPAVLRIYVQEPKLIPKSSPVDQIRANTVQSVAMVNLLLKKWYEPPPPEALDLSTLVQQTMSLIAERGGGTASQLWQALCEEGPFDAVNKNMYGDFLRSLASKDLLIQSPDGTILLGQKGERIVNHYEFYAAFQTPEEYRLMCEGRTLGSLPIAYPVFEGVRLIFAGKRWAVISVDDRRKVIDLVPTKSGRPPLFGGGGMLIHDRIREEMKAVYNNVNIPSYLDANARELLKEGRLNFMSLDLDNRSIIKVGQNVMAFCWTGDKNINTLLLQCMKKGFRVSKDDNALTFESTTVEIVIKALQTLVEEGSCDANQLAGIIRNKEVEKYDPFLEEDLLNHNYASKYLDSNGAWHLAKQLSNTDF